MFPDDEIVFQTTESLWEDGDLSIAGMRRRSGEPADRPDGTFGWEHGVDGERYGFFGHALSVVAVSLKSLGKWLAHVAPEPWRHAIRSDHYMYHRRSQQADWPRLAVSLTNAVVTAVAAWMLVAWLGVLGFSLPVSAMTGLCYAFGTLAWPYSRTFLSEPLSALVLLASAVCVARFHAERKNPGRAAGASHWLWAGGVLSGLSVHVHVLNLIALPCLLGYALLPLVRDRALASHRRAWLGALGLGLAVVALLGLSHYLRFGDPWETGRHGHYSHFIVPGEGLAALLVAPGRSFFFYSPVVLLGLVGWPKLRRRLPDAAWFAVAVVATRLLFVSARSDWFGGWGVGPRYLVPAVPFAVLPLAVVLADLPRMRPLWRRLLITGVTLCIVLEAHLAAHSIWEWMNTLMNEPWTWGSGYLQRSHWLPAATPIVGFFELDVDMLSVGSARLLQHGHSGMAWIFRAVAIVGLASAVILGRTLGRPVRRKNASRFSPS